MLDVLMIALVVAFFAGAGLYAFICERLQKGLLMVFDLILGAIVSAGLLVYLVYALLRPERF